MIAPNREDSQIPANANLVINHVSSSRPYFRPRTDGRPTEENYFCVFTIESADENMGYIYVTHFPEEVNRKPADEKKQWLFENMAGASFIKAHPLK